MKNGDIFYIKCLDKILQYEVTEINVVEPSKTENIKIAEGEDLITLVTCTPRYINTHRLLVTGTRVPLELEDEKILNDNISEKLGNRTATIKNTLLIGTIIFIIIFILLFSIKIMRLLLKKGKHAETKTRKKRAFKFKRK